MKSLLVLFSMIFAMAAFAKSEPVLVACSDDQVNYNVLFLLEDRQVVAYAINEGNWGEVRILTNEQKNEKELFLEFAEHDDTHFGYVFYNNSKNAFADWKVKSWTAGNDSDNYYAQVNDNKVYCDILLKKTESAKVDLKNIFKKI